VAQNGLLMSQDQGRRWKVLFRGKNSEKDNCQVVEVAKSNEIYLGTKAGLFISADEGKSWHKAQGQLGNACVSSLAQDSINKIVYVVAENKVFKYGQGTCTEIFIITNNQPEETEDSNTEEVVPVSKIKYISVDPNTPSRICLATDAGIYLSQDQGASFRPITDFGLLSRKIKFVLFSSASELYAVNEAGIFKYQNDRWQELSLRLAAGEIRFLAIDNQNNLYAATEKGFFRAMQEDLSGVNDTDLFKSEPTIKELHRAAILYVQVIDPARIEAMRNQARIKAILPEVSLDYDRTVTSYSNSSLTRFSDGPTDWGVSLKWSLSDLIWSEQQRLIDSQVRLMAELRNDILDEVNKIYFERRKVKVELAYLSQQDSKKISEKKLRLEELSASLDALTGGYFSQHLKD
jgi:hypothetical protein